MIRLAFSVFVFSIVTNGCLGQNLLAAYNSCRSEFNVDMETFNAIKNGDFSIRTPFIECFGDCLVKKAGFMNDDLSFNEDVIVKFMSRFIKPEDSKMAYDTCTADVTPILCTMAYEVYQCIYEKAYEKWGTRRKQN
ncbi:general odorant-binding protein 56d-like [Armigeres subalbatus]|uniref:general odorant-binding protein 56d-like n=1 Tax=Armigeres subalbatus TaxID=124917 RepID=UPI002ED6BA52